jgi:hypothetical protein
MKKLYAFNFNIRLLFLLVMYLAAADASAQPATVSNPLGVSRTSCTAGSYGIQSFTYNGTTNQLFNNGSMCIPTLAAPGFSGSLAGDAFNPKDQMVYYVRTIYTSGVPTTYIWRWNPRTCPGGSYAVYQRLNNTDIAGLVFDANGVGYWMEFTGAGPYTIWLRTVDFSTATPTLGALKLVSLPAGVTINNLNGDLVLTPSGIMMFSFDDKLLTVNYQDYATPNPLVATYIGPVKRPTGANLVGLAYADGKIIASYSGGGCPYKTINILTGDTTAISYTGGRGTVDYTNITSGIGAAKKLVSATPTGVAGQYDLVYDILVKNYGNVPDSSVQLADDLGAVFGAANVSNVSLSWVGPAPANFTFNSSYTGKLPFTNVFVASSTNILPNYPVSNNNFTVRISCRVSSIAIGVVYNNNAVVTATGYQKAAMRDVSTDGTVPDLNTNDKPDDVGEDKPTPFFVSVVAETPPCIALNKILYSQDFGAGTGLTTALPGTAKSEYAGSVTQPIPVETYTLSNNAANGNTARWVSLTDHTGNANGRMLLVNADVQSNKIFMDTINVDCSNLKYSFFAYAANIANGSYANFCNAFGGVKNPKLIFLVRNASNGTIITNVSTPDITSGSWTQYGMKFVMPAGVSRVIVEIFNSAEGGCGNDLALDDIQFGLCDPQPTVTAAAVTAGCIGAATSFTANMSDTSVIAGAEDFQWQSSVDGVSWSDIPGANSGVYTIASITASDRRFYRVLVASAGNITNATCRYTSNSFYLNTKNPSVAPISALKNKGDICPMEAVILSVNGGSLGTNANWRWYSNVCGGTFVGTGSSITVNPTVSTTYYVRAEGDCNMTACASIPVIVNCTSTVLEINFTEFKATPHGRNSLLTWNAKADKLDYFEVERSTDGRSFIKIGNVDGAADPSALNAYSFNDYTEANVEKFYRIRLVTTDGVVRYTHVIRLHDKQQLQYAVAPNPATSQVNITYWSAKVSNIDMKIIDATGRTVISKRQELKPGNNSWTVYGLDALQQGLYTIQIFEDGQLSNRKLVIHR